MWKLTIQLTSVTLDSFRLLTFRKMEWCSRYFVVSKPSVHSVSENDPHCVQQWPFYFYCSELIAIFYHMNGGIIITHHSLSVHCPIDRRLENCQFLVLSNKASRGCSDWCLVNQGGEISFLNAHRRVWWKTFPLTEVWGINAGLHMI